MFFNNPISEILILADPKFSIIQMVQIGQGFINGLKIEEAKSYANKEIPWLEMINIRMSLISN